MSSSVGSVGALRLAESALLSLGTLILEVEEFALLAGREYSPGDSHLQAARELVVRLGGGRVIRVSEKEYLQRCVAVAVTEPLTRASLD